VHLRICVTQHVGKSYCQEVPSKELCSGACLYPEAYECWQGEEIFMFPKTSWTTLGPTRSATRGLPAGLFPCCGRKADCLHPYTARLLIMSGAISPLPCMPSYRRQWQIPFLCVIATLWKVTVVVVVVAVVLVVGAYQHCSREGLLYSNSPDGVPSFIPRGAAHQAAWETSASEGRNEGEEI
jgi:hypothetical protein